VVLPYRINLRSLLVFAVFSARFIVDFCCCYCTLPSSSIFLSFIGLPAFVAALPNNGSRVYALPVHLGVFDGQRESRLFYMYRFHFRRIIWALLGVLLPCRSVRLDNRPLDSVLGYDH